MSISEIISDNDGVIRKTLNSDLYYKVLCALAEDDKYRAKMVIAVNNGDFITEDRQLSAELRKLLKDFLKRTTTMTDAEADTAISKFHLTADQAKTLSDFVHESDYITMKHCKKKLKMFNKPDFEVEMSIEEAKESARPNPQDRSKIIKIPRHDVLKAHTEIYDFQKKIVHSKK